MYNLIASIIDHSWSTNASDQQYIYMICGVLIPLFSVFFLDLCSRLLDTILPKGGRK